MTCPAGTTNAAGDDASGPDTSCDALNCATRVRISVDGVDVYHHLLDVPLPAAAYFGIETGSINVQSAGSKLDDLTLSTSAGGVLYSDTFSSPGSWLICKGAIGTTNIAGGTANAGSDWNFFRLGGQSFDTSNGFVATANTYWSSATDHFTFFVQPEPFGTCCAPISTTTGGDVTLHEYAAGTGPPVASVNYPWDTEIDSRPWAAPAVGWHTLRIELVRHCKCGDGNLDPGETCDDGNTVDGDGCSALCVP